mmetsp:Transcript_25982/g.47100  ORF Transcript_25982/g.47100 Transcript_25982/m.47100 type:complete len:239 (+) Transcript_25982:560-1276(+)
MLLGIHWTKFRYHGLLHQLSNGPRLLLVHGSLIGQTNLVQHGIRIKSLRNCVLKILQKCFLISPIYDVIGHHLRLLHILYTDVILTEGHGGHRLLMGIFSVDDGCQSLALMLIHRVPHLAHPRTGGIHNIHIFRIEQRHLLERRPERWQNHHVSIPHLRKVLLPLTNLFDELHVHIVQLIVHLRVVNQFICNVHLLSGEMLHSLVRQGNTTFYAPAESKVLREVDLHAVFIYHKVVGL